MVSGVDIVDRLVLGNTKSLYYNIMDSSMHCEFLPKKTGKTVLAVHLTVNSLSWFITSRVAKHLKENYLTLTIYH